MEKDGKLPREVMGDWTTESFYSYDNKKTVYQIVQHLKCKDKDISSHCLYLTREAVEKLFNVK